MVKKGTAILCLAALLTGSATMIILLAHTAQRLSANYAADLKRISYCFFVQNTSNQLVNQAELRLYAPVAETPTQRVITVFSSHPYSVERDEHGNRIFHYTFDNLPPYASRVVSITAELLMRERPLPSTTTGNAVYLLEEPLIEVDDPRIRHLAQSLKAGSSRATAEKIFRWMSANIRYAGYVKNNRGARQALQTQQGDCTEMMALFVALCRAAGVPARGIAGYHCPNSTVLDPAQYHNWAEFYAEGRWRLCDPQRRVFMQQAADYIALRVIHRSPAGQAFDFDRFKVVGEGVTARMHS